MPRTPLIIPLLACTTALAAGCGRAPAMPHAGTGVAAIEVPAIAHPGGETAAWWYLAGAARAAANGAMHGRARNVIVFLGDGMSFPTVAAARILQGQRAGDPGEENALAFEDFPYTAISKTYNVDFQTPDSAATMTAIATGAKTRYRLVGVGPEARYRDCASGLAHPLLSILELAESAGMATGVVTTTRLTHATPAATYAHVGDRGWEDDADLSPQARDLGCVDIARQLVETPFGDGPEVALGGGRERFMPASLHDPEYAGKAGLRRDGRDLVAEWRRRHRDGAYAWNARQLRAALAAGKPALLGLFEPSHMHYESERGTDRGGEPSLAEMTSAAIETLSRGHDGYFLLVEGGRIDHGHHEGNAYRALTDTIAFSDAVRAAVAATSASDTLILVTADHSHTLAFAGYARRGNPILGKVEGPSVELDPHGALARDADGLPYTVLGYANGPGRVGGARRPDLSQVDTAAPGYLQEATVPLHDETHAGDDVGVWARGPGAEAVHGTIEQNVIYHLLVQATPRLRDRLCAAGDCNRDGVPVVLPDPRSFTAAARGAP